MNECMLPTECDDIIPVVSTIGKGPKGKSYTATLDPCQANNTRLKIVDEETGEVQLSPNLSSYISVTTVGSNRTEPGQSNQLKFTDSNGAETVVNVNCGVRGSYMFHMKVSEPAILKNDIDNTYDISSSILNLSSSSFMDFKPYDTVIFRTKDQATETQYLTFGSVVAVDRPTGVILPCILHVIGSGYIPCE